MHDIIVNVVSGLLVAILIAWFGLGGRRDKIVVSGGRRVSKVWKGLIVIGWVIVIWGFFYYLSHPNAEGFVFFVLGLLPLGIGRFGSWWSRD